MVLKQTGQLSFTNQLFNSIKNFLDQYSLLNQLTLLIYRQFIAIAACLIIKIYCPLVQKTKCIQ